MIVRFMAQWPPIIFLKFRFFSNPILVQISSLLLKSLAFISYMKRINAKDNNSFIAYWTVVIQTNVIDALECSKCSIFFSGNYLLPFLLLGQANKKIKKISSGVATTSSN